MKFLELEDFLKNKENQSNLSNQKNERTTP